MYNIYISYPYNMLTVLSKVTDKEFINFNDTY